MAFFVTRTGLDAFDVARAWGLAGLLNVMTEDEVAIRDAGWAFIVEPLSPVPNNASLSGNSQWSTLIEERGWQGVFITYKGKWEQQREKVQKILETQWKSLLAQLQEPTNIVTIGKGETLPGGLDPTAFKSLRHFSKATYTESNISVQKEHWALACLGMATCGTYRFSREAGQTNWLALLAIPQAVRFSYFRDVKELLHSPGLRYHGVQNAAAHYAVQLAEQLRKRASAQGSLQDTFSAVLYFTLFGAGQQTKPSQGSQLNLAPLMNAIKRDPHGSEALFRWLNYCFRLGSTEGAEDLALSATELVMRWDLDAFERLVWVLIRFLMQKRIKYINLPTEKTMQEVMQYVVA